MFTILGNRMRCTSASILIEAEAYIIMNYANVLIFLYLLCTAFRISQVQHYRPSYANNFLVDDTYPTRNRILFLYNCLGLAKLLHTKLPEF